MDSPKGIREWMSRCLISIGYALQRRKSDALGKSIYTRLCGLCDTYQPTYMVRGPYGGDGSYGSGSYECKLEADCLERRGE